MIMEDIMPFIPEVMKPGTILEPELEPVLANTDANNLARHAATLGTETETELIPTQRPTPTPRPRPIKPVPRPRNPVPRPRNPVPRPRPIRTLKTLNGGFRNNKRKSKRKSKRLIKE